MSRTNSLMMKRIFSSSVKTKMEPYLLILPALCLVLLFKVFPIVSSVFQSFFMRSAGGQTSFVGLQNYVLLFGEEDFINSIWVTLKFNLITIPIQVFLAVAMALMLNRNYRAVQVARTILYIPVAINMVVASTIWNLMLNPSSGLINSILAIFNIPAQPFLTSKDQALYIIVLICCWKGVAYWMMFLLAGLQNISSSIYEAGRIDGTNSITEFLHLTLPMLKNSLVFVTVSNTMINLFMFAPVYMLTRGGPEGSTDFLMYQAYRSAFKYSNYSRSYAIVTVMLVITATVVGSQFMLMRDREERSLPKKKRGAVL